MSIVYSEILVPLDGSPFAETALPHAVAIASKFGSHMTLVKVFETPHVYQAVAEQGVLMDVHQAAVKAALGYLDEVKANLEAEGVSVAIDFLEGEDVPAMILEAIEVIGADLVVMSTHGRSGLDRWMFGSVARRVTRHSQVPVVLIHPKV